MIQGRILPVPVEAAVLTTGADRTDVLGNYDILLGPGDLNEQAHANHQRRSHGGVLQWNLMKNYRQVVVFVDFQTLPSRTAPFHVSADVKVLPSRSPADDSLRRWRCLVEEKPWKHDKEVLWGDSGENIIWDAEVRAVYSKASPHPKFSSTFSQEEQTQQRREACANKLALPVNLSIAGTLTPCFQ